MFIFHLLHCYFISFTQSGFANLADGNAVKIIQGIFKEVQVQTLQQVDRRTVYNIINCFLHTRLEGLYRTYSFEIFKLINQDDFTWFIERNHTNVCRNGMMLYMLDFTMSAVVKLR